MDAVEQETTPAQNPINDSGTFGKIRSVIRKVTPSDFYASLERPFAQEATSEKIIVRGWAYSTRARQVSGEIIIERGRSGTVADNASAITIPLQFTVSRTDVAHNFQLSGDQTRVGFEHEIPWSKLGSSSAARVTVHLKNEVSSLHYGPLLVFRVEPHNLQNRSDYKSVWESVTEDHGAAMEAVAGFRNYDEFMASGISTANTMIDRLAITKDDVVLEIGCGTARIGAALAASCKKWIGTDISAKMLEYARQNLRGIENAEVLELPTCSLSPFADGSINCVYCSAVFMHLDEWDRYRYVQEAFRVLAPGGRAYFDNMDLESAEGWKLFSTLAKLDPMERPANISKCSTAAELGAYVHHAGFLSVQTRRSGQFIEVVGTKPGARTR